MKMTLLALTLTFTSLSLSAASRNLCDDLIESGTSSPEQIKRCQDKFGVSEHAKEQAAARLLKEQTAQIEKANENKQQENIEWKKFTADDLFDSAFGKMYIATKIDYRWRPPKEKRVTEGDALCSYLGYEKSIKSVLSSEIMPQDVDKRGLIVDTSFFGKVSKEPELYRDPDLKFTVRKYVEITCARRKDKSADNSDSVFKKITEDLVLLPPEINGGAKKDTASEVNNGPRGSKETKTPNGYNPPEWAKEDSKARPK